MRTLHKLILVVFLSTIMPVAKAQNSTEQQAVQAIGSIKSLFGKKKKAKQDSTAAATNGAVANGTGKTTNAANEGPVSAGLSKGIFMAGKFAPNIKYIDYDQISVFNYGAAVVQKGSSYALIDTAGNFVVPYNKYRSIVLMERWTANGIFYANTDKDPEIYLNSQGKVIVDSKMLPEYFVPNLSEDKKFLVCHSVDANVKNVIIVDREGRKTPLNIPGGGGTLSDSVFTFSNAKGWSFINMKGKVFYENFDSLDPFTDGVSVYGVKDQFGQFKYGVISSTGKIIIPPQFSMRPDPFTYGMIMVRANQNADFDRAHIDKTGKIILKETKQTESQYGYFGRFDKDYCQSTPSSNGTTYILDKSGKIITMAEFLSSIGIQVGKGQRFTEGSTPINTNGFAVDRNFRFYLFDNTTKKRLDGIYNLDTHQTILFNEPYNDMNSIIAVGGQEVFFFTDPVSHFTFAKLPSGKKNRNGYPLNMEGFVNKKGEYVLVKGEAQSDF